MITAAHVINNNVLNEKDKYVVGIQGRDGYFKAAPIVNIEDIGADIAIIQVVFVNPESSNNINRFKWSKAPLEPFTIVRTVGYAYGSQIIDDKLSIIVRGFQGEVVSRIDEFRPIIMKCSPFKVYELSFLAPRGISGAPLLNSQGKVKIHGIIIGNTDVRMMVFRSEEKIQESQKTTIVEQYEALTLGIAVTAEEILARYSKILGGTLLKYLGENDLLE